MKKLLLPSLLLFSGALFAQEKTVECPMGHGSSAKTETTERREAAMKSPSNKDWWPTQLNLEVLRQNSEKTNPMGEKFNYISEFQKLDYFELKKDIEKVLT